MTTKKLKYGELSEQLDSTLTALQDPECDVDEAVVLYQKALQLIASMETQLSMATVTVKKIKADFSATSALSRSRSGPSHDEVQ